MDTTQPPIIPDSPCTVCEGIGFMVMDNDEHGIQIERCDTCCGECLTDEDATRTALELATLALKLSAASQRDPFCLWANGPAAEVLETLHAYALDYARKARTRHFQP